MANAPARIPQRINIGGIKLSNELVQFIYTRPSTEGSDLPHALKAIAAKQINISFFTLSQGPDKVTASFCVDADDHLIVQELVARTIQDPKRITCLPSIGTLTVFPHRNSFTLLGRVIQSFSDNQLPVYGLCTSISALSVITAFQSLDPAIKALETIIQLPENHAPFRQEFNIRQISL